jgi:CrcB protein
LRRVTVLLIAAGGLIGVLARYGLGTTVSADNQPWMTFAINMIGSLVLGAVLPWSGQLSEPVRAAIAIGFCGGFTTFSTVSVQVFLDARSGDTAFALLYLGATIAGGVLAAALGYYAGRALAYQ